MKYIGLSLGAVLAFGLTGQTLAEPATDDATATAVEGMQAGIDAETGQIRALTPAESAALARQGERQSLARSGDGKSRASVAAQRMANGGTMARVPQEYMSTLKVNVQPDGSMHFSHGDEHAEEVTSE